MMWQKLLDSPSHFDFQEVHGDRDIYEGHISLPIEYWKEDEVSGSVRWLWKKGAGIAHALRKYFHEVPTKNGSLFIVSMAQNPMGIRTQFKPAPIICFKLQGEKNTRVE